MLLRLFNVATNDDDDVDELKKKIQIKKIYNIESICICMLIENA